MKQPNHFVDLTGRRFGRLTVFQYTDERKNGEVMWLCKCDCGEEKLIRGSSLITGASASCGCLRKENSSRMIKTRLSGKGKKHDICKPCEEEKWYGINGTCEGCDLTT